MGVITAIVQTPTNLVRFWKNVLPTSSTNNCDLRSDRRNDSSTVLCRHCGEYKTLSHVVGKCKHGELLRTNRHHRVCDIIVDALTPGWKMIREDRTSTCDGDSRISDIVAIAKNGKYGYIRDPMGKKHLTSRRN
ncbi:hypothetical protein Bhyg_04438 [Pseudolycoriella hygida]|uniref:Uncharacterized protein n=1 Tax=Pseudolycoriella hygida TaxID=35572 RepID=A0A9Q0NGR8_9DIPT|nr:hypothetical protein Bhyg_04438 [Pseudolycoriella hygida]